MVEDIVTTDETIEINDEVDSFPSHPYDPVSYTHLTLPTSG